MRTAAAYGLFHHRADYGSCDPWSCCAFARYRDSANILVAVPVASQLHDRLSHVGWAEVVARSANDLLQLATKLGRPGPSRPTGPILDRLIPLSRTQAHPRSMSAIFGEGAFPFHTDLAHYSSPPRFVLLRAAQAAGMVRPTLLQDFQRLPLTSTDHQLLAHGPFLTRSGPRPFLSAIVDRVPGLPAVVIRYDGCCMTPASSSARTAELLLARKMNELEPVQIDWHRGRTIVLDNWRVLHARASTQPSSYPETRVLQRILVWPSVYPSS